MVRLDIVDFPDALGPLVADGWEIVNTGCSEIGIFWAILRQDTEQ